MDIVWLLIQAGADVDDIEWYIKLILRDGKPFLHTAGYKGYFDLVEYLLTQNVDINEVDK